MQNVIAIILSVLMGLGAIPGTTTASENSSSDAYGDLIANRASAGRFYETDDSVWWANVFDGRRLYRWDKTKSAIAESANAGGAGTLVAGELGTAQYISEYDGDIYFSATAADGSYNVYRVTDGEPELFIADAFGALFYDGYVYYHNTADAALHAESIYRMSLADGKTEKLVDGKGHEWLGLTISVTDGCLYLADLVDLYACDLETLELTNLTGGRFAVDGGINKPQYRDGAVYFYTYQYNDNAAIYRYVAATGKIEQVLLLNGGDFWCDVLLVDDDRVIFNGRQASQPDEGEQRVRGLYEFDLVTGTITLITTDITGPTCYLAGDDIISIRYTADTGENAVTIYTETDDGWYGVTVRND